jgi:hypothetical protein
VRHSILEPLALVNARRRDDPGAARAHAREHVTRFRQYIFGLLEGR